MAGVVRWLTALAVGAIWEQATSAHIAKVYPPRGRMVDVGGGRRLHLDCRGTGTPVVVFEAGLDTFGSANWAKVQDSIARTTRACSYDRAGLMWSDPSPTPPTAKAVADDLHVLLKNAGETGPFVMVGHSFAGPWLTNYTQLYGSEVAGLVFNDTSHPDQQKIMKQMWGWNLQTPFIMRVLAVTKPTGLPRLLLGDRPVIVLSGPRKDAGMREMEQNQTPDQIKRFFDAWDRMQADQASWSTRGRRRVLPDSGHYVQLDRPDAVLAAVNEVVAEVRKERR